MERNGSNSPTADEGNPTSSSNIAVDELDEETAQKLRGDAIGDTMYSERFVLTTLMKFSNLTWNPQVEDNLCFLWDMTGEQDVCEYLFQASYPTLACSAIENYTEPRFIEIVVGILANLLSSNCEKSITNQEVTTVLNLLNSEDPFILIQVMRFVHALSYMFADLNFFKQWHLERFDYILNNSMNNELLSNTLKSLAFITMEKKVDENILKGHLVGSAITAYRLLKADCESEQDCFESEKQQANIKHFINVLSNICSYVNMMLDDRLKTELSPEFYEFMKEMDILFSYYNSEDTLLPITEQFKFYVETVTYICRVLGIVYIPSITKTLYEIFAIAYDRDLPNSDEIAETLCYFISVAPFKDLQKDLNHVCPIKLKEIFSYIFERKYEFEFDYASNITQMLIAMRQ